MVHDRNLPEDDYMYTWEDEIDPDHMPKKWIVEDYEYQSEELIPINKIIYGVRRAFSEADGWNPWFKIGVQTFYLQPVETEEHAWWYVKMLKIAFGKLKE